MTHASLKYLSALLLFGFNGIVASHIALPSCEIVLLRAGIGCAALASVLALRRQRPACLRHPRELLHIALSGAAMGASWMCLYEGYVRIGVCMASLLYYCGPVIVMALSPLLFHERLTRAKLLGFAAVFAGVLLVNGSVRGGNADMTGLLCGAASAVLYAVMITENKRAVHITGQENAALQLLFGFLTAAVFVGIRDRGFAIDVRPDDWGWIVLLGAVNTGLGCYWYFSAIGQLPVQTVAVCGYLEPLAAVVCAAALLNETMQPLQILGAVLILCGAAGAECVPMLLQRHQKC